LVGTLPDNNLVEFQGFLVSDEMVDRIADHLRGLKTRAEPLHLETVPPTEDDNIDEPQSATNAALPSLRSELPVLTEGEWEVLRISVDELDGDFTVSRLYEELGGQLAKNAINDLGQRLQDAGWLLAGSGNKPRTCTDALIEQVALHYGE
jgi:hypothetical protein